MADEETPATPAEPKAPGQNLENIEKAAELFAEATQVDGGQPKPADEETAPAEPHPSELAKPEDKPADKPAEPPKSKPKSDQVFASARQKRALEKRQAEIAQREAHVRAEAERLHLTVKQFSEMREDELLRHVAQQRGMSLTDLMRRGASWIAGKEPEAPAAPAPEVAKLQARLDAYEAREKAQEISGKVGQWREHVVKTALAAETAYPTLTLLEPAEIADRAYAAVEQVYQQTGVAPAVEDVLQALETLEAQAEKRREEKRQKRSPSPAAGKSGASSSVAPGDGKQAERAPSRTVTNRDAAAPATAKRELSLDERLTWAGELFAPSRTH